jgi:hypothetical protein
VRALALPLLVLVLAGALAAGCSGDDGSSAAPTTTAAAPPPHDHPDDEDARETLDRFVQAAGARDMETMWSLLDSRSQARYGPTPEQFAAGPGNDLAIVLGEFAREGGQYESVLAKRIDDRWSVAAVTGYVTVQDKREYGAYAAVVGHEDDERRIALAGTVNFNPVTPEPELVAGDTPSIATEVSASEPVLDTFVWVDDTPIASELAPDAILLTGEVTSPLQPGRHTVVTYADTQSGAGANAYGFESD